MVFIHPNYIAKPLIHVGLLNQMLYNLNLLFTTHPFNGPLSGTTRVGRYQKGKTNLDFSEATDSE